MFIKKWMTQQYYHYLKVYFINLLKFIIALNDQNDSIVHLSFFDKLLGIRKAKDLILSGNDSELCYKQNGEVIN